MTPLTRASSVAWRSSLVIHESESGGEQVTDTCLHILSPSSSSGKYFKNKEGAYKTLFWPKQVLPQSSVKVYNSFSDSYAERDGDSNGAKIS